MKLEEGKQMTSKEALEIIYTHLLNEIIAILNLDTKQTETYHSVELYCTIKQDLDHLEALEKENGVNKIMIDNIIHSNVQLVQENEKLKEKIEELEETILQDFGFKIQELEELIEEYKREVIIQKGNNTLLLDHILSKNKENEKLKKVIYIIKNKLELELNLDEYWKGIHYHLWSESGCEITQQEYELLKEVLGNE